MGAVDPLKGPLLAPMKCSEIYIFNPNYDNRSRPKIIPYLPLSD